MAQKRKTRKISSSKLPKGPNVTLYVKDRKVWETARERALSFDDSLSEYVEYALRFFNCGGQFPWQRDEIMVERTWTAANEEQAENRLKR